ncbi:hypothetical protein CSA56_10930 [candidate division KSB3 bacterium]|uniref:DUF401 family protein n=1 Tax=candidate division KSB3 bacterium TaxID=2044937 RepID=A0A2G6KF93_9BACT|nr:MAG: hypothetical protein CSA56_10930 [candidate division KSB3 bacterium]
MLDVLGNPPILLKIIGVFALVIFCIRKKQPIGTAMLAGALLLGVWCRMSPRDIFISMATTMFDPTTLLLSVVVVLILILSRSLDTLEQMKRLLASFQGLVNNVRFNLIVFPALIGLLPMPGGAIFSAPMVDELGNDHALDPETKSLLNYWFRHVWEFAWPLYPSVLLISSMTSISLWTLVGYAFPLTLISTIVGYLFLLKNLPITTSSQKSPTNSTQLLAFFKEMTPVIIVIAGAITGNIGIAWLQGTLPALAAIPNGIPLILSLLISILYTWWVNKASFTTIRTIILNKSLLMLVYMIVAIFIFKEMLVDSHAVTDLSNFLAAQQIPLVVLTILIPFIVGIISGIAVAFIGTSFPVLLSVFETIHLNPNLILPYLILGFCAGFAGVLFSPLHVCLIFTREYFDADFRHMYHRLWQPTVILMLGGFSYFWLLVFFLR